jgi:hypothetical protein
LWKRRSSFLLRCFPAALLCKHQAALPDGEIQGFGDFTKAFTLEQRPALIAAFKI